MVFLSPLVFLMSPLPLTTAGEFNEDEAKVPAYSLPDPLTGADGTPIKDAAAWRSQRRPELMQLFEQEVYGRTPVG